MFQREVFQSFHDELYLRLHEWLSGSVRELDQLDIILEHGIDQHGNIQAFGICQRNKCGLYLFV